MKSGRLRACLLAGAAITVLVPAAIADDMETVIVTGVHYRDLSHTDAVSPTLSYGLDYFQPFEPATVGDMMKRVPSVAFLSDMLEYDGVRLRGLDPAYTQILINGKKMPGAEPDRSFWVDRIPAELVERVEIMRSGSADRSGDAMAGALNIVLRDAYEFNGGYLRAGGLNYSDGELKPSIGGVISGGLGTVRGLLGFNIQGRHNPKDKTSLRYEPGSSGLDFANREDQSDVRDGTDYSVNGELGIPVGAGTLKLNAFYVYTDRTETEHSYEYENLDRLAHDTLSDFVFTPQLENIEQHNYTFNADFKHPLFGGDLGFSLGYSGFDQNIVSTEEETVYDGYPAVDEFSGTREFDNLNDREWTLAVDHKRDFGPVSVKYGFQYSGKKRDGYLAAAEIDTVGAAYPDAEPADGGVYRIDETRLDGFVKLSGKSGAFDWEAGLRYETTSSEIADIESGDSGTKDYDFLLPSMSVRYSLTEADRITLSGARTVRRPNFEDLSPVFLTKEPTKENDWQGNPNLKPESAWGFDIGYERRLGEQGVAGVNFFYRSVSDLIELSTIGPATKGKAGYIYQPTNIGDGKVWGVEFDLSAPLSVFGLPDTGVFANYSLLDSEIVDPVTGGKRRFNDQAQSVYNVGFIHDIKAWGASFGTSYRKQGGAFSRVIGETVSTTYGGDLEAFVEKRFGEHFVVRLSGSNLLDASKDETFNKWSSLAKQLSGSTANLKEYELESEKSGPVFQIVARYAF
jgi:outer membrane receptor protein involved in Fe transport